MRGEAVNALPMLATFLSHHEPEVRICIASALAAYPEAREEYLPLLKVALANKADEEAKKEIGDTIQRLEH